MPNGIPTNFTAKRHSTTYDYISPLKLNLAGKHVLSTGAAWEDGVGYATATAFARAGASAIAVVDLHSVSDELVAKLKMVAIQAGRTEPDVLACTVDIAKLEDVQAMHNAVVQRFSGRIDVVINNAAHMEPYTPFLETDPDVYWRTWELEYGERGVLTFSVNPGAIKTKITEGTPESIRNMLPDRPDIAGDTLAWLAAERREWLGGRYISCPWDLEELMSREKEIVEGDKLKLKMTF